MKGFFENDFFSITLLKNERTLSIEIMFLWILEQAVLIFPFRLLCVTFSALIEIIMLPR